MFRRLISTNVTWKFWAGSALALTLVVGCAEPNRRERIGTRGTRDARNRAANRMRERPAGDQNRASRGSQMTSEQFADRVRQAQAGTAVAPAELAANQYELTGIFTAYEKSQNSGVKLTFQHTLTQPGDFSRGNFAFNHTQAFDGREKVALSTEIPLVIKKPAADSTAFWESLVAYSVETENKTAQYYAPQNRVPSVFENAESALRFDDSSKVFARTLTINQSEYQARVQVRRQNDQNISVEILLQSPQNERRIFVLSYRAKAE